MGKINFSAIRKPQRGFTLLELFIVMIIFIILIALLLPITRSVREPARRTKCQNNLRQLVIACHNYQAQHGNFPAAMGGQDLLRLANRESVHRLSGFVSLLPYIEQQELFNQVTRGSTFGGTNYSALPAPWDSEYPPWHRSVDLFLCPSSESGDSKFGQTNYAFCIGDVARGIHESHQVRGAFAPGIHVGFEDVVDGSSQTIAMAEMGTSPEKFLNSHFAVQQSANIVEDPSLCLSVIDKSKTDAYGPKVPLGSPGRGGCWADGAAGFTLFNTILPPNSPSCAIEFSQPADGIYSAGGFHVGGINVVMVDGSTHFISLDIDAGDPTQPTLTKEQLAEGTKSQVPMASGVRWELPLVMRASKIGEIIRMQTTLPTPSRFVFLGISRTVKRNGKHELPSGWGLNPRCVQEAVPGRSNVA